MTPQPDIALGRVGIWGRITALGDLVQLAQTVRLASAAVIGHVVTFVSLPVILRIYGPEAFGEYSLILSIGTVVLIAATLKLEIVIPTMQHVSRAARLASALLLLSVLVGLAVYPAGMGISWLTGWTPGHAISTAGVYAVTAGFVCLFAGFLVMRNLLVRLQALAGVALMQIVRPVGFVVLAVAFGLAWPDSAPQSGLALLLATVIAVLAGLVLAYVCVPVRLRRFLWPTRWRRSVQEIRSNTHYLSAISVSQIFDLISLQIPLWTTAALYGATPAGWVALAGRVVFMPAMILGASLGPVLNRRVSASYYSSEQLAERISTYLILLGLTGLAGFGLIAYAAPWLTDVAFGGKWEGAAPTLRIYCLYGFAYFLSATTAFVPILMHEKTYLVLLNAMRVAGLSGAALAAYVGDYEFETFIAMLAAIEVCAYLYSVGYTVHLVHRHDAGVRREGV